jgi:hypothetical protein
LYPSILILSIIPSPLLTAPPLSFAIGAPKPSPVIYFMRFLRNAANIASCHPP